jgi:hypothetical protein
MSRYYYFILPIVFAYNIDIYVILVKFGKSLIYAYIYIYRLGFFLIIYLQRSNRSFLIDEVDNSELDIAIGFNNISKMISCSGIKPLVSYEMHMIYNLSSTNLIY